MHCKQLGDYEPRPQATDVARRRQARMSEQAICNRVYGRSRRRLCMLAFHERKCSWARSSTSLSLDFGTLAPCSLTIPDCRVRDSLSRSLCSGCVHSNQFVSNSDVRDMHIPDSDFGTDSGISGGVRAKPFPVVTSAGLQASYCNKPPHCTWSMAYATGLRHKPAP